LIKELASSINIVHIKSVTKKREIIPIKTNGVFIMQENMDDDEEC